MAQTPDEVVFRRRGGPRTIEVAYLGSLVLLALCSFASHTLPFLMVMSIVTMVLGLEVMSERIVAGSTFEHVRATLSLRASTETKTYREAAAEAELAVDDRLRFPLRALREVVIGRRVNHAEGATQDFSRVFLVLNDQVIEVDVYLDKADALRTCRHLAERFDVPMRETNAGSFGTLSGFLFRSALLMLAAVGGAAAGTGLGVAPAPALGAIALWAIERSMRAWGQKKFRKDLDEEVRQAFRLGTHIRVETETEFVEVLEDASADEETASA
ncbi:MAG: hypothetical protein AAGE52_01765 [Myxococcota bacterium]